MTSTCPLCRWSLRYVLTETGLRFAVDPEPTEHGTVVLVDIGWTIRGHVLVGAEMPWLGSTTHERGPFTPHVKTCGRRGRPAKQPPCAVCERPLHPIITARGGRFHWLCAPAPKPRGLFTRATDPAPGHVQTELMEAS